MYLVMGSLPWMDLGGEAEEVLQRKEGVLGAVGNQVGGILEVTRGLEFAERPDYRLYY